MSTVIKKWKDLTGLENDDWYYYKTEEVRKNNPLDDDYVLKNTGQIRTVILFL